MKRVSRKSRPTSTAEFTEALEAQDRFRSEMLGFIQDYDAIVAPVASMPAPEHGATYERENRSMFYTGPYNITGWAGRGGALRDLGGRPTDRGANSRSSVARGCGAGAGGGAGIRARRLPTPAAVSELIYRSASWMARAVRAGELSAVELVDAHLERIDEVNPALNAVVALCAERAREEARAADAAVARGDELGALHGVPFTLKDSHDTAGVVSTGGTLGRKGYVPKADSTVAARLREAGAILLGKTSCPELTQATNGNAMHARANNPYTSIARRAGPAAPARRSWRRVGRRLTSAAIRAAAFGVRRISAGSPRSSPPPGACRARGTLCPGDWSRWTG